MLKFCDIGCVSIYAVWLNKILVSRKTFYINITLQICVILIFIITSVFYMSVTLYGPSLALSQVTGLDGEKIKLNK